MLRLRPGMDITMVVGQDITEDTMDGAATMDTPTDTDTMVWDTVDTTDILTTTDTVTSENALLMPNPKLMPNLRLRLLPGTDTMVDTTVIPTGAITDMEDGAMDVVTGGKLSVTIPSQLV